VPSSFDRRDGGTVFGFAGGYREHGRTVAKARIHAGRPRLRISALSGSRGRNDGFVSSETHGGRVFRTVTVRNETRSHLNEPKSRCNGNRRCCLSLEWCGGGKLRTPNYENQKPCFFVCLEFRFSEQNDEIQPEKVTRKIVRKKVCIINHLYFWRRGWD
jgi:hypothetical protein